VLPLVLTEARARQAVNLPPVGTGPDAYTDLVVEWVEALTEFLDARMVSVDSAGLPLWATTADLPRAVTIGAAEMFRENWSIDVGAHSDAFGPARFEGDAVMIGPAWVMGRRAMAWLNPYLSGAFA
jgi:hypothetical protein